MALNIIEENEEWGEEKVHSTRFFGCCRARLLCFFFSLSFGFFFFFFVLPPLPITCLIAWIYFSQVILPTDKEKRQNKRKRKRMHNRARSISIANELAHMRTRNAKWFEYMPLVFRNSSHVSTNILNETRRLRHYRWYVHSIAINHKSSFIVHEWRT